jgi:hypothetical protein
MERERERERRKSTDRWVLVQYQESLRLGPCFLEQAGTGSAPVREGNPEQDDEAVDEEAKRRRRQRDATGAKSRGEAYVSLNDSVNAVLEAYTLLWM